MNNLSHYAVLGGNTPYDDQEMRKNIVDKHFEGEYEALIMFESPDYENVSKLYSDSGNWELLYRSNSYQGYAYISSDKRVIKGAILANFGIIGVIYIKK